MSCTAVAATGAVIVVDGGKYLLQLRDAHPGIWYPGHWGLFGGQCLANEPPEAGLRRELAEELGFFPRKLLYFSDMTFNFGTAGSRISRTVFEVVAAGHEVNGLDLREGSAMRAFEPQELESLSPIVPCDRFVLDMHMSHAGRVPMGAMLDFSRPGE